MKGGEKQIRVFVAMRSCGRVRRRVTVVQRLLELLYIVRFPSRLPP